MDECRTGGDPGLNAGNYVVKYGVPYLTCLAQDAVEKRKIMLNKYPRRDAAYFATASGVTLVDRRQPRLIDVDSLSAHIWLGINGLRNLQDIADVISERYNQPVEDTRATVEQKCGNC
jgi:hypothetical protein